MALRTVLGVIAATSILSASAAVAQQPRDFSARSARVVRHPNGAPITAPSAAARPVLVSTFLRSLHAASTIQTLELERQHVTSGGITHLRYRQVVGGLEVGGTYVRAAVSPRGEILSVIENLAPAPAALVPASGTHRDALEAVLAEHYPGDAGNLRETGTDDETVVFERGMRFTVAPTVTRIALPMADGTLQIAYRVVTWDRDNVLRHTVVGDGGRILLEQLRTNTDNSYLVFPTSPFSAQEVRTGPAGWVATNTTSGANADAYLDVDNDNLPDAGGRPVSATRDFHYVADLSQEPSLTVNRMAAVTNLFYLTNVIHDTLYVHGFTEFAGNFQGGDPVLAEAQDGGGINNANFATPDDGSKPRMQMYLWNRTTPGRDGALDSDIVWHEYGHGLTWRMIGNMTGPLAGAVGEGMSDVLAIFANGDDRVGEYATNNPNGIRRFPYTNYPHTYSDVGGSSVHQDGEIYAAAVWKLREMWLGAGGTQADLMDVLVGGMNYTPQQPAFEDMRDGLIAAATTTAQDCVVWRAFAAFGIGEGASGDASCNWIGCQMFITESFAIPASCSVGGASTPVVTITAPASGASQADGSSVTFSGTAFDGVTSISGSLSWTSNLNGVIGAGASFSTTGLTVGTHTITASVTDGDGFSDSDSISVTITPYVPPITLTLAGRKVKSLNYVDLTWTGPRTQTVDIHRNGSRLLTTANSGSYTDNTKTKGSRSFTYKICEAGSTSACSPERTIVF